MAILKKAFINVVEKQEVSKTKDEIYKSLLNLSGILQIDPTRLMNESSFDQLFKDILTDLFEIDNPTLFMETFGTKRKFQALITLASTLKKVGQVEFLTQLIKRILSGDYLKARYDLTNNDHLNFLDQKDKTKTLLTQWKKNTSRPPLEETDDYWEIFLSGLEINESCLSVSHENSQGLLGLVGDGQNRLIAVKNSDNEIIARRFMQLLWDEKNEKPVLFLEPPYTRLGDHSASLEAIKNHALEKAKALNLDLYEAVKEDEDGESVSFTSKGGAGATSYIDGVKDHFTNGEYEITKAKKILNMFLQE